MIRASAVFFIVTIHILLTATSIPAQPADQYGDGAGTVTLEMYRQQQIDQQLEMQKQQIEMQRQQIEIQRQQLETQRQQMEMEREKQRMERQRQAE